MHKIHFIVNPVAKNGYALKIWQDIENILHSKEIVYKVYFTEYQGHAKKIAAEIADDLGGKTCIIAVVGGDGTVHEAVNGIVGRENVIIADIPAGSGNDFSRGFQLPLDPIAALKEMLNNLSKESYLADVGRVLIGDKDIHYFVNNLGAGFDALVAMKTNRLSWKRFLNRFSLGTLAYAYVLIKELFTYKTATVYITVDDKQYEIEKTWLVSVANHPYIGGGMKLAPDAAVDDGYFSVTVIHHLSKIKLLFLFVTVFWGGHKKFKEVSTFRGKHISVRSSEKMVVHADGEHIGETPATVDLLYRTLAIVKGADRSQTSE